MQHRQDLSYLDKQRKLDHPNNERTTPVTDTKHAETKPAKVILKEGDKTPNGKIKKADKDVRNKHISFVVNEGELARLNNISRKNMGASTANLMRKALEAFLIANGEYPEGHEESQD
jgi:hypothetical protein